MLACLDQVYAERSGIPLRYDVFRPEGEAEAPLVVCIHGGGWISGEKEGMHDVAAALVQRGFVAACPQYRLAPLHPYPAAVDDILSFVQFAREQRDRWRTTGQIATLGNSAGGHLSAMAGLKGGVNAVVDICGLTDMTRPREQHFPISWGFIDQFLPEESEEVYREASPLSYVTQKAPPFLVIHGEADDVVPVEQSEAFVRALREAGGEVEYHRMPGESHGFTFEGWTQIEAWMTDFLERHLTHG